MSAPKDQYPNDAGTYPGAEPENSSGARPSFGPAVEAELQRLAPSRVTVLLVGGDAPERYAVALALHERSPRARSPFVAFACDGLEFEEVERGLFGGPEHAPPAGGAIVQALGGTLYVAGVDALPLLAQPRFLRFLDQDRPSRVVASAARDLARRAARGDYRLDLAERLSLVQLALPGRRRPV